MIIAFVSWLLPLVLSLLPLAWDTDVDSNLHKVYVAVVLSLFIFVPCTAMEGVYMRVLRVAHRFVLRSKGRTSNGNITNQMAGKDEKANRVFAMVFAMFLLRWLPLIYINICWILNQSRLITNEMISLPSLHYCSTLFLILSFVFSTREIFEESYVRNSSFHVFNRPEQRESHC